VIKLKQAVVVEGKYDKNTLAQVIDAPIFETNGFGVMRDPELLALLRAAAETRGLVILTDPDGAGFVIRNYLKGALPKDRVLHAYIPDVRGKERRKAAPGKEGKLGVEGMRPEVLLQALWNAGAEPEGVSRARAEGTITKGDLFAAGLSGGRGSAEKRRALEGRLGLPERMSANALLQALNLLYTRETFFAMLENNEETT